MVILPTIFLLALILAKQKDWSFPKGHIEEREEIAETTRREVREETGLSVKLLSALPPMEYGHPTGDTIVVYMFLMQSEDDSALRPEVPDDKVVWVNFKDVYEKLLLLRNHGMKSKYRYDTLGFKSLVWADNDQEVKVEYTAYKDSGCRAGVVGEGEVIIPLEDN